MLKTDCFLPSPQSEAAPISLLTPPITAMPPRRLRHYLVGAPADVQHAIDRLHLLGYLERIHWSHAIDIPENGVLVYPDAGDVLRYCQRDRTMG